MVDGHIPRQCPQAGKAFADDFAFFVRGGGGDNDAFIRGYGRGVEGQALAPAEGGEAIAGDGDAAAAIGLVGGDQIRKI